MPLLAPLFLLGLAAIAVPVLVHLVRREKKEPIAFPSLMFLQRTPTPMSSRRNLRDPWLLLLRVLAVAALVLAFARPVFGPRPVTADIDPRRRDVVLAVDRSFSMRVPGRWPRARAAVDSVLRTLGPGDRVTLVPFDRRAIAATATTGNVAVLRAAFDSLAPTDESTRLAPAIALAQERLATSDAPRKALVVVSDLQRSGWDLTDDSRLPAGTELTVLDVGGDAPLIDRAVRSVEVRRDPAPGPARVVVTARITNTGPAARGVPLQLVVAGRTLEQVKVDLPRDGAAAVSFAPIVIPPDAVPAQVSLAADALPGDDAFHFLLNQAPVLPALLIETRPGPFVSRALAIGRTPEFVLTTRSPARVSPTDLAGRRLVLLADGAFPTGLGAARLLRFVEEGGGVIVAMGDQMSARSWPDAARRLLPGRILPVTERPDARGAVLGALDQRHPALALLTGTRAGDLTAARFFRYRAIDTTGGVLARFDDGTPALVEHTVGRGRVLVFGSGLDGAWNDLPRQPAFLPLLQQLARHAVAWRDAPTALPIGASVRPGDLVVSREGAEVTRWVATTPSGARVAVGGADAPPALELTEAGVVALRPGGSPGARPVLVAANVAPAELDFATFDRLRLATALAPAEGATAGSAVPRDAESLAEREARQSTWWYLLLGAALLLAGEALVARRAGARMPAAQ